ncbi:MAG: UDP-N-acetylmuramoyl-tripeptide--D-alanyl-D-alanine ligase [Cellulosilyticaceae bacterium]
MQLLIDQIIDAIGGKCLNTPSVGNNLVTSISIDSRNILLDSLFIPIKGDNFDGHKFISSVFEKGAIATLTQEERVVDERIYTIYVEDTKKALLRLASYYRTLFEIPVIAVTGSVGKTSTKDLIAATLSGKYTVHKTEGNFNNEIGLPLTLFGLNKTHDVAVIEMGMNHFGEIHKLSLTAKPDIAVITNIGVSHIENLGSQQGILTAKLEILDGLSDEGLLVLNGDDPLLQTVQMENGRLIKYGRNHDNTYYAENVIQSEDAISADITTPKEHYAVHIATLGEHMIANALAAIAVAEHLGLSKDEILRGLASYSPSKMRMNKMQYPNSLTIIDDTYNASPDSMKAALKVLSDCKSSGKKIAVLGDMFEMGEHAPNLHEEVGKCIFNYNIDVVCTIGNLAKHIAMGARQLQGHTIVKHYETQQEFLDNISQVVSANDTILFKASRGMHFEKLVDVVGKVSF